MIRQGYGCENLISHLTEMISMVLYTFEYGDSESKMGPKNCLPQYHVNDDVIDDGKTVINPLYIQNELYNLAILVFM